jgi:alpha-1,3-glucosyltransferase
MFAILLNFKHIYLYCAPCFGIFYLKKLVFNRKKGGIVSFILLGAQTIAVFAISFGPFIYTGQLKQIFSRLFPFQRGLVHYYWASNVWALHMFFYKYAVNIYKMMVTGEKVPCVYIDGDLETYKLWSLVATLAFLLVRSL